MSSRAALALLVAGAALSLVWLVHPWYDATNDASLYILTARSLLAGEGYSYLGEPFRMRPPGFPLLIAPVLAWFGTDFAALNATVGLFGVACVALLFLHQRERLGVPLALAVCAAVWMNAGFRDLCGKVLSDVPGAALMLAVLVLEPWARRRPLPWRDALLGALIAAATTLRSANGLLLPAVVLSRMLEAGVRSAPRWRGPWRALWGARALAAVTLLLLLPWEVRDARLPETGPAEQTYYHSYGVAMWRADPADPASPRLSPGAILGRAPERLSELIPVLGGRLEEEPGRLDLALGLLALACGLVALLRWRGPAEIFAGLYLVVLAFYFEFGARLVLPLHLLAFPAVALVARALLGRALPPRFAEGVAVALVAALGALDAAPREGWAAIAEAHRERQGVADFVAARYPDATLGAPVGWHLAVHLGRPVHSLQFAVAREGIEAAWRIVARERIGVLILDWSTGEGRRLHEPIATRFGVAHHLLVADLVEIPHPEWLAAPADGARRPSFVLVSVDTLRADHLGAWGYERDTSPHIDRFAARSLRYANAWAPTPWTLPSHVALLTGRHPLEVGISDMGSAIPDEVATLPEILSLSGYATAAFVDSGANGFVGGERGFARGFDTYVHEPSRERSAFRDDMAASVDAALEWLDQRDPARPFFLFLHTKSVHAKRAKGWVRDPGALSESDAPYDKPEPWRSRFLPGGRPRFAWHDASEPEIAGLRYLDRLNERIAAGSLSPAEVGPERIAELVALYDAGIAYVDEHFGRLLEGLAQRGLGSRTVVILTSDHGESFLERRTFLHLELHPETLRVPLILHDPEGPRGVVPEDEVHLMDVAPAILARAGLVLPAALAGRRLPEGGGAGSRAPVAPSLSYYHLDDGALYQGWALRDGPWKLLLHRWRGEPDLRAELFDLEADPGERAPLAGPPERVRALRAELERRIASLGSAPSRSAEIDAETREELRELGYATP